jgi:hypothetical protein
MHIYQKKKDQKNIINNFFLIFTVIKLSFYLKLSHCVHVENYQVRSRLWCVFEGYYTPIVS